MTILGKPSPNLPFTICSAFRPTVLEGQLCYSLNLSMRSTERTKAGTRNSLLLIMDPGMEQGDFQVPIYEDKDTINLEPSSASVGTGSARIYIDTLGSFSDYRAGSFSMTLLKKMTGTDNFLKLTDEKKKCQLETFVACQTRKYTKEVMKECGCVPWALSNALTLKVGFQPLYHHSQLHRNIRSARQTLLSATHQWPPIPMAVQFPALDSMLMYNTRRIRSRKS